MAKIVPASRALARLKDGNQRFARDQMAREQQDPKRRKALAAGQAPFAGILSCADSRVVPELAFDAGLGELFVCRVAGNVANASSIASLEYAVAHLGVRLIVVLGHQACGAVGAAMGGGDNGHNLNHLLAHITPALGSKNTESVVRKNAKLNAEQLVARSPILSKQKGLKVVPAYYALPTGKVRFL